MEFNIEVIMSTIQGVGFIGFVFRVQDQRLGLRFFVQAFVQVCY